MHYNCGPITNWSQLMDRVPHIFLHKMHQKILFIGNYTLNISILTSWALVVIPPSYELPRTNLLRIVIFKIIKMFGILLIIINYSGSICANYISFKNFELVFFKWILKYFFKMNFESVFGRKKRTLIMIHSGCVSYFIMTCN